MAFCSYCGCQVSPTDRFCTNCGASLIDAVDTQTTSANSGTTYTNTVNTTYTGRDDGRSDYEVILSGLGSCAAATCNDLLEDLLGYTDSEASALIANIPVKIGDNLTFTQAQTIAQALTEYGALISVVNGNENVDIGSSETSLFNADGSFIKKALAVIATISLANRVTSVRPYRKPSLLERIFRLSFRRSKPPVHIRRPIPHKVYVRPQNLRPGGSQQFPVPRAGRPNPSNQPVKRHEFRSELPKFNKGRPGSSGGPHSGGPGGKHGGPHSGGSGGKHGGPYSGPRH